LYNYSLLIVEAVFLSQSTAVWAGGIRKGIYPNCHCAPKSCLTIRPIEECMV